MKNISAGTKYPNTRESDQERLVMHVINGTNSKGEKVFLELMAECPIDAMEKASKFPEETWNKTVDK